MQSTTQASAFEQLQLKYLQRLAEQYGTFRFLRRDGKSLGRFG